MVVDVETGFLERESRGSHDSGFVAEAGGQDAEVLLEGGAQLVAKIVVERSKEEWSSLGDAATDDDGFWVQEPAAVHQGGGEFFGDPVPDFQSNFVAAFGNFCQMGRRAVFVGLGISGGFISGLGHGGDLLVADVVFERAAVAVGSVGSVVVDGRLAEFAGNEVGSANHAAINDESASDSGAERKGHEVIEATSGPALPFGVGHAIGVIFHGDGEINALAEFFLEENTLPSFDVGQVVDHAGGEVDKAGHSDADGFDFGVTGAEFFDEPGNLLDQGCGLFEFLGVDPGGFLNDIATVKDSGFHRSSAKIDSNSKRDVTHYRKIRGLERKGKRLFLKIVISLSNQANSMEC